MRKTRQSLYVMRPGHRLWDEFYTRLAGPEACNFRGGRRQRIAWDCSHKHDMAKMLLIELGANVAASLAYFLRHGVRCDCEIIFNLGPEGKIL